MASWYVLGFDYDAIVGAWQDWRLARQCVAALTAAQRPLGAGIFETAGDGPHLTFWYLRDDVAGVLDAAAVPWRRFLVGRVAEPPAEATAQLKLG